MKITAIECLPVHAGWRKNFVFVRIETDAGIVGWGESYSQYDRDRAVAAQVEELGRYLIGRDPFQIKHILQIAFDDYAQRRGSLELFCATSGIEQALWDIVGKATKQPVYNLLGGPVRDKIRVYANGPDVDLLLDIHRRLAPMHAIDRADALAEFKPYWLEEPCQCENIEALAEVRQRSKIPTVTGEALYTRADFRPIFRARAADIINPDVSNCGGILELVYIAAQAETEAIAVSPHNYNSTTLALSATVHASAVMPNFIITEYFLPFEEIGAKLCPNLLKPVNGYISLPEGPGLGIEVDEKAVRAARGQQFPARTFRFPKDEGP
jgi:galactonate dehydratase